MIGVPLHEVKARQAQSAIWQVTCNFAGEMQTQTSSNLRMDVPGQQSAVLEMKEVLAHRLPYFYRCALRLLGNTADAEDAVQEALLAAHRHIGQFRGQAQMTTWLTTIVRNCALMQLRRRRRQTFLSLDEPLEEMETHCVWEVLADGRPSPEDECRNSELSARLRRCTALLSPPLRRTFELRVMKGLSIHETARLLGVPRGTVKAQLARARKSIARYIKPGLAPRPHRPERTHR
jgi:RNA polymerase sigma-70 factor, ECF subfamily